MFVFVHVFLCVPMCMDLDLDCHCWRSLYLVHSSETLQSNSVSVFQNLSFKKDYKYEKGTLHFICQEKKRKKNRQMRIRISLNT